MYKMTGAYVVKPILFITFYMFHSRLNIMINCYVVLAIETTLNTSMFNIWGNILH